MDRAIFTMHQESIIKGFGRMEGSKVMEKY